MNFIQTEIDSSDGIEVILKLVDRDEEIGFCRYNYNTKFRSGYLHEIKVNKEYLKKGHGSALIQKAEEYLKSKKIENITGMANAIYPEMIDKKSLKEWWIKKGFHLRDSHTSDQSHHIGHLYKELTQPVGIDQDRGCASI
jgi:GNAT superfamily N-acetyltransferase